MDFWDKAGEEKPPIAGTWTNLYLWTIGIFCFYVIIFTILTQVFS
ncbi:hypothetical protein PEDI_19920 [Persicobacter diffluens]|uniref:Uncharacterized protein n=1 Tax=Persicobacter diffluens TaxID=981 RepID=A0AAN4VZ22_9BACT|nr:hypothetical protein PEDI_19920 [Persicobacter diffluens]